MVSDLLVKMELLSDAIFGNGKSIPGEEDISTLLDERGFPYYKGGTMKGVFRESLARLLAWSGNDEGDVLTELLGKSGSNALQDEGKMVFSDFVLSETVKEAIWQEIGNDVDVTRALTHMRTFTRLEDGMVARGSLRMARCVNKGLCFYGHVSCDKHEDLVMEAFSMIKGIGTMRNRGFGEVRISVTEEG